MRDRQTCVGCGKKSPETETNYTLISAQFGWRLTRYKSADGTLVVEWRCPSCWREYKRARNGPADGPPGRPASQPPPPLRTTSSNPRAPVASDAFKAAPTTPSGGTAYRQGNSAAPPSSRRPASSSPPPTPAAIPPTRRPAR